jgi:hypothetical protein
MVKNILCSEMNFKIMFFSKAMSCGPCIVVSRSMESVISFRILNFAASANIRK